MTPGACSMIRPIEVKPIKMSMERSLVWGAPLALCPCSSGLLSCFHSFSHHLL